jgi:hypothetical protein
MVALYRQKNTANDVFVAWSPSTALVASIFIYRGYKAIAMKRLTILLFVLAIALAFFHYFKKYSEDSEFAVKFHVYSQEVENPLHIYVRTIPGQYDRLMAAERVQPFGKELALYKVKSNTFDEEADVHYLLYDRYLHETTFLKSRFLLKMKPESVNEDESDSYLIDFQHFTQYRSELKSPEEFVTQYATMLASEINDRTFRRIRTLHDLDTIRQFNLKAFFSCSQSVISDYRFIEKLKEDEFLFWYYDKGIIKFTVTGQNGKINSISTKRLGLGAAMDAQVTLSPAN